MFNGQGTLMRHNKLTYTGKFVRNKPEGKGTEVWKNGTVYVGEYKGGKKEGRGKIVYATRKLGNKEDSEVIEEFYEGDFKNDIFEGEGEYQWLNLRRYKGSWVQGKMEKTGEFYWPDGSYYVGEYSND